jgi:serine/threonine-protein phosphatase 5
MIFAAWEVFSTYESLVYAEIPENGTITVCGDTHGQFYDVCNIFKINGEPSETNAYLFNGDFVDRGSFSLEVILTLLAWKLALPNCFHLTRGNHETIDMNKMYGFEGEVRSKLNSTAFDAFTHLFGALPLAIVISKKIFVVHGGIPRNPETTLEEISKINRFIDSAPDKSIMSDLLWADPQDADGIGESKRGVSMQFGPDITKRFLDFNNLTLLIRSHEVKQLGSEYQHNNKCMCIFFFR